VDISYNGKTPYRWCHFYGQEAGARQQSDMIIVLLSVNVVNFQGKGTWFPWQQQSLHGDIGWINSLGIEGQVRMFNCCSQSIAS